MSTQALNQVITQFAAGHVTSYFLVLARLTPLFIIAPLFSSKQLPAKARALVAVAVTVGLTPIAVHGQVIPSSPLEVAWSIGVQLVIGFAFALAVTAVFTAITTAGAFTDSIAGFNFGSQVDPINGNPGGTITQLYSVVGLMMFIAIGGDAWLLRGIAKTFTIVPVTAMPQIGPLLDGSIHALGTIFIGAIEVAAPAILALIITDVAFGVVSRVVPQLNIFSVAFPLKIGVTLLIVGASLPFVSGWISDALSSSVYSALHTLRIA
jgi:flagellar biosynthetic protein FliR